MQYIENISSRHNDFSLTYLSTVIARRRFQDFRGIRGLLNITTTSLRISSEAGQLLPRRDQGSTQAKESRDQRNQAGKRRFTKREASGNTSYDSGVKGDKGDPKISTRISKMKNEQVSVFDLVDEIKNLASQFTKQTFRKKNVGALPNLPFELELAEGWSARLISADAVRDTWYKKAEPGSILPEHFHPHISQISTVISGSCFFTVSGKGTELKIGESITVPQGKPHEIVADQEEGCELMVVYQPPLTAREKET